MSDQRVYQSTPWHAVRVLTKSLLIRKLAERIPEEYRNRIIYGLSIGILDDGVAGLVERLTPPPSQRIKAWDDDPQELYSIPEVRKFYQHFHRVWPYWFFFCDLRTETLTMMTLCLMPNLSGFKRLGEPNASVEYDPKDLLGFIMKNWVPLNMMMERAGMSEMDIFNRSREVFLHYKLPYDQPPPEE